VDRSLVKMAQTARKYASELDKAVGRAAAIRRIITELRTIFRNRGRVDHRRKTPGHLSSAPQFGLRGLNLMRMGVWAEEPRGLLESPSQS
jgi:hypothetical protein